MTDKARIKVAAAVTALFLAAISAAGVAMHGAPPQAATTPSVATQAQASTANVLAARGDHYEGIEHDD
jgi:hypothetical protein